MDLWLALFGSTGIGAVAFITFWVNLGKNAKSIEDTAFSVATMAAKLSILETNFANHRVEVATNYTTNADLKLAIESFQQSIDKLDRRLEVYIEYTIKNGGQK